MKRLKSIIGCEAERDTLLNQQHGWTPLTHTSITNINFTTLQRNLRTNYHLQGFILIFVDTVAGGDTAQPPPT
jgi:hypothetical protein